MIFKSFRLKFKKKAIKANGGRCGECGDDWKMAQPRPNEEGGGYFIGRTVRYYSSGALIPITIEMTAVHNGYFEFRLCTEKKTINELVTQQCLDKNLLRLADGTTRFTQVTTAIKYTVNVQLPLGVSCQFCVIQWRYVTGILNVIFIFIIPLLITQQFSH